MADQRLMARRTQPPSELRSGVQTGVTGKRQLAAATVTFPHRRFVRGGFRGRCRIFHSGCGPSPPVAVDAEADERESDDTEDFHWMSVRRFNNSSNYFLEF